MRALLLVGALSACAGAPLTPQMHERVQRAIAADLVAYPELEGRSFSLSALDEPAVFFQSNFTVRSVSPVTLDYALQVNPRAFALGIDDDMLRGVIGHELAHTLDYQGRTMSQLIELAPQALLPAHHSWERFTDLVAVDRGFGPGLLRYRVWQFRVLGQETVADKKRVYYGPAQLASLMDVKARCPQVFRAFLQAPPASTKEIATPCP